MFMCAVRTFSSLSLRVKGLAMYVDFVVSHKTNLKEMHAMRNELLVKVFTYSAMLGVLR